ncbi:hypothetical protein LZ198_15495 [Myxococcus sp. K15C18031901]|uniref:hypothetical protein n=1 Tax=Myxococcus dinghuensis TaxID=2906761 RepID=UPI0020A6E118|nr:hypothetical protein [Myxococcus dinghuensis]MCP3100274.1 hypothetical protein [Myxococcus dinghuensis]
MGNGNLTIWIQTPELVYDPPTGAVSRGAEVTFRLGPNVLNATVTFEDGSCFDAQGPFPLSNITLAAATSEHSVKLVATPRNYPFKVDMNVDPGSAPKSVAAGHLGSELETKKGGIDVTTDPPKDVKK